MFPSNCTILASIVLLYDPHRTDRVENTVSNSKSIVAYVSLAAGKYLLSRCLETALHGKYHQFQNTFLNVIIQNAPKLS
jgi:hypothetical protein